jgi:hypothetical protein
MEDIMRRLGADMNLKELEVLVLDEADRLLDMGFEVCSDPRTVLFVDAAVFNQTGPRAVLFVDAAVFNRTGPRAVLFVDAAVFNRTGPRAVLFVDAAVFNRTGPRAVLFQYRMHVGRFVEMWYLVS